MKCLASKKAPRSVTNGHLAIRIPGDKDKRFDSIRLQAQNSAPKASGALRNQNPIRDFHPAALHIRGCPFCLLKT